MAHVALNLDFQEFIEPQDDHQASAGPSRRQRGNYSPGANWILAYLAQYFDITTDEVIARIIWSWLPLRSIPTSPQQQQQQQQLQQQQQQQQQQQGLRSSYIERFIQSKPDLYGPLWICVTLIFTIAFSGNTTTYLEHSSQFSEIKPGDNVSLDQITKLMREDWHYNFYQVNLAASCILTYVFLLPMLLWSYFWFRGCTYNYSLFETICAYGYSLSIFIPVSIVMLVQVAIVQYCAITLACLMSAYVLVGSFLPVVHSDPSGTIKSSYLILILIAAAHALLAFTLHLKVMKSA